MVTRREFLSYSANTTIYEAIDTILINLNLKYENMKLLETNFATRTRLLIITSFLMLGILFSCSNSPKRVFYSSYEDIQWSEIGYYDAMFHTHPGLGDEEYDPHQTVDRYFEEGYKILTLAGHDYDIPDEYIESIYPWTELSQIYEKIKDVENPTEDNKTYGEFANEPYENRNPVDLDMISVEGCEVSGPHHMISLFNSYTDGASTESKSLKKIEDMGGLVYFAHPGRYVDRWGLTEYWYVDFYKRFDALIGQAVYNRVDTNPDDRQFYDKIVHILGADRPIWLFGEDDMHSEKDLGWNRNVILLEYFEPGSLHPDIQNGSALDVKEALKNGRFYLWKPSIQYNRRTFDITNIEVSDRKVSIEIDNKELVKEIRWLTYNPAASESITLRYGNSISIKDIPAYCRFARAEIEGVDGVIYTQPFYIK